MDVLHAADEGWLQRAVEVKGQLHIIEELQLFNEPQPVDSIVISQKQVSKWTHFFNRTIADNKA